MILGKQLKDVPAEQEEVFMDAVGSELGAFLLALASP